MCGIFLYLRKKDSLSPLTSLKTAENVQDSFNKVKHRGPDFTCYKHFEVNDCILTLGFHRLSIVDLSESGNQPFVYDLPEEKRKIYVLCNGEIYNHKTLKEREIKDSPHLFDYKSTSDCAIIGPLYIKYGIEKTAKMLETQFAFVIVDIKELSCTGLDLSDRAIPPVAELAKQDITIYACRDRFGIRPLYYSSNSKQLIICSELKGMVDLSLEDESIEFPSSTIMRFENEPPVAQFGASAELAKDTYLGDIEFSTYYSPDVSEMKVEQKEQKSETRDVILSTIQRLLVESVERQLMSDVPIAFLLSGGVDSSLVCGIANRILRNKFGDKDPRSRIRTFTIGMEGGTDIKYAEEVAKYIDSDHTTFIIPKEEALAAVKDVVYCVESYDITTVRASVFQYLIAKYISKERTTDSDSGGERGKGGTDSDTGGKEYKVIFCGEGSDEIFQGYKEFSNAPNPKEGLNHSINRIKNIYLYDGKRCDRCLSYFGKEARVPFLDHHLVDYIMSLDPVLISPVTNGGIEKKILRDAFSSKHCDGKYSDVIPDSVLYRKKEALSDGCSSQEDSWYMILQKHINNMKFCDIKQIWKHLPPKTNEQKYYRNLYEAFFGKRNVKIVPEFWLHKWSNSDDPSARTVKTVV